MKNVFSLLTFVTLLSSSFASTTYLNMKAFIQGYYDCCGEMVPAAVNQGCPWQVPNLTDRVQVYLRKAGAPYTIVATAIGNLYTNGNTNTIPISHTSLISGDYWIVVKNTLNAMETWSSTPVNFKIGKTTSYDFTIASSQAFGKNMVQVQSGVWAFYSGDVNHSGCIDDVDQQILNDDIASFAWGCISTDLNGDGNTDLLDSPIMQNNLNLGICVKKP